jgi:Na+-driven multidrug efflux pump
MLDLTTPFCIVMAVNVANFLLNELLMVMLPYGMAGCGWASVVSQVQGCLLGQLAVSNRQQEQQAVLSLPIMLSKAAC